MKVFIVGMGAVCCLGENVESFFKALEEDRSGIRQFPEWASLVGQRCLVGGEAVEFNRGELPRSIRRSMSKMSEMAYSAMAQALHQADLTLDDRVDRSRILLCLGSTTGSPVMMEVFFKKYFEKGGPEGQMSTAFLKTMNHSVAANVAMAFGFEGPVLSPSSACTTSSQAMILGWELMQTGLYDIVIAGGADEIHPNSAAVFDIVHAASTKFNDRPQEACRPFAKNRDGLVVSEGASVVVIETEAHANKRRARPLAEFLGGAYICDGVHMTHAQASTMSKVMRMALSRTQTRADEIDYVNAHATGTVVGDNEETKATAEVFGNKTPVSSLKGHMGHSLAACGTFEVIASVEMMRQQKVIKTRNLIEVDPECNLVFHPEKTESKKLRRVVSNNFAFGGINSSLVVGSLT